jgi:hypothetical protein
MDMLEPDSRKGLTVGLPSLPKGILVTPRLATRIAAQCQDAAPLVEWLAFAAA